MTTLTIKNQELETDISLRDLTPIVDGLSNGSLGIPDIDLREINVAPSFFYSSNNLIISLSEPSGPPLAVFSNDNVRIHGFWKYKNESTDGSEFGKYRRFRTPAEVVMFSPTRIIIRLAEQDSADVENYFQSIGVTKPDYGALTITVSMQNVGASTSFDYAYLIKYTHNPLFSSVRVTNPPLDLTPGENIYKSSPYSTETLFVPTISSSFVYNFFEPQETEYSIYDNRNYRGQKLSDIPKYIKLNWTKPVFDRAEFERQNSPILSLPLTGSGFPFFIPSQESESEESGAIRLGGIILSAEMSQQMAEMMASSFRTSEDAASIFDGSPSPGRETEAALGVQSIDDEALERAGGIEQFQGNRFVDDAATSLPIGEMTINNGNISDYVGYIIEKSKYNEDGSFEPIDLIAIGGKDTTEFIDWKIAYGEIYRYRIRSIFKFYNRYDLSMFFDSDSLLTKSQTTQYVDNSAIWARKVFYFDSAFSESEECQTTEAVRPNPPTSVRLFANSRDKKIFVSWNQKAQNRDVVGFNIYRTIKGSKNSVFTRLNSKLIDIRNNYYFDYDIEVDVDYIYALESIDFHGNFSQLSAQFSIRIKQISADVQTCEQSQKFEDVEGRELGQFKTNSGPAAIIFKRNFAINVNPLFKNVNSNDLFVLRVTSLDTGIKKEIKLNFRTLTIYHSAGYRPPQSSGFLGLFRPTTDSIIDILTQQSSEE